MDEMAPLLAFLVDDDDMYLKSAVHNLESNYPVTVQTFSTAEDAIKELDQQPDVVILDYYLNSEKPSAMSGLEALKKVKQIDEDIEVIMLSAQDDIEVAINSVKNGALDYVVKNRTAFVRVGNDLRRVKKETKFRKEYKDYRVFVVIMSICFIIVAVICVAYALGFDPATMFK